jgi:glycopeptide antibiotics resistance protein
MLLPMGVLLPILMGCDRKNKRFGRVIFSGFFTSFTIEVLQLIGRRGLFEFDDMFHNTLGVMIGYGIYWLVKVLLSR